MSISVISFIGILAGIAVFVFLAMKGTTIVVSALSAALVMILTSGANPLGMLQEDWAAGFAGFLKSYFLIFVLSSLFGRVLSDSGSAKRIALSVYHMISKSKKNQKLFAVLFVPMLYIILSYVGISGFVLIFTILNIAKQIFQECDVPWRMYCYGGSSVLAVVFMGGSLQIANIAAAKICGTSTSAAMLLSLIATGIYLAVLVLLVKLDLKKAEKNGEGFMETGAEFLKIEKPGVALADEDESKLPNLILAIIPMLAMVLSAAVFNLDILISLGIGIVLCFVLFFKRIVSIKETLTAGVTTSFAPVMGVAATFAIASVIKAVPGFGLITAGLGTLPPLFNGIALIGVMSFALSSSSASIPAMGPLAFESFVEAGLTPAVSHRLMLISTFTALPPHSSAIANVSTVTKIPYKSCLGVYMKATLIPGICAFAVSLALIMTGIFH
ncbi:MAG: hypothetical protein LBN09_07870 [Clostridioides sp.]|jgi:H+/gluconate symporter-like permease|nr:hypothetical protein [Clostridioides sp.]